MTGLIKHFKRVHLLRSVLRSDLIYHEFQSDVPINTIKSYEFTEKDFKQKKELSDHPVFTAESEKIAFLKYNLARKALKDSIEKDRLDYDEIARNKSIYDELRHFISSCYISLLHFAMNKFKGQRTLCASYEDEYEVCCMTLMRSIDLYNPTRGFRFTTYAMKSMLTNLYSKVHTNRSNVMKVWNKTSSWNGDFGQNLKTAEVDWRAIDINTDCTAMIRYGFKYLTPNQRHVLKYRFGLGVRPLTLEEVSAQLGLTKERIRQIESKALRMLEVKCDQFKEIC